MGDAPFDEYLNTPNKSIRQNVPRKGVCLHHAALTSLDYLQRLAMGAKEVSATAIVKDRVSKRLMTDEFRAWSLSSAWADSSFRSVETCNQSTDGWTISDESHWELAYLVAYWALTDGFWPHRDGDPETWTVLGHREVYTIYGVSYGTACPGGMDLDLVTKRAQDILRSVSETPRPKEDDDMIIYKSKTASTDREKTIPANFTFAQGADGVLRPLSSQEFGAYAWWNTPDREDRIPVRIVEWDGDDVLALASSAGLRAWDGVPFVRGAWWPQLTGAIVYPGRG